MFKVKKKPVISYLASPMSLIWDCWVKRSAELIVLAFNVFFIGCNDEHL